jgi:hypothetical protein
MVEEKARLVLFLPGFEQFFFGFGGLNFDPRMPAFFQ